MQPTTFRSTILAAATLAVAVHSSWLRVHQMRPQSGVAGSTDFRAADILIGL